jgi:hypothetical protein
VVLGLFIWHSVGYVEVSGVGGAARTEQALLLDLENADNLQLGLVNLLDGVRYALLQLIGGGCYVASQFVQYWVIKIFGFFLKIVKSLF